MSWMMSLEDAKYSTSQCEYIKYGGFQIFDKYSCQILTSMATKFPHLWLPNLSQKKDKITFFHQTKKPHYKSPPWLEFGENSKLLHFLRRSPYGLNYSS